MKNKLKSPILLIFATIFWLAIWEIIARVIKLDFIIPTVGDTVATLLTLIKTTNFWISILFSFLRIIIGFLIGVLLGLLLAPLTHKSMVLNALISPIMTIIKSTPVASIIMVMWVVIGSDSVPLAIAILMVMPLIWESAHSALNSADKSLLEVCFVYKISAVSRLKILYIPLLISHTLPAILTASALAWKSGIAAEIISYTTNSIGKEIFLAKSYLDMASVFAWTIVVILLSLAINFVVKHFLKAR